MSALKKLTIALLLLPLVTFAQTRVLTGQQGGTGIGSVTGGDVGKCLKVLSSTPFAFELGSCGGAGSQTPWTQNINGAGYSLSGVGSLDATSSVITQSTSTNLYTANLKLGTLSGILKATNGTVGTASAGTDYESPLTVVSPITRTINALGFDFGTQNTWTGHNIFSSLFATRASSTYATTTSLDVTGTGTSTFSGPITIDSHTAALTVHNIQAHASDGIFIRNVNGGNVALLGAGSGQGATFYGGVNIDGATRLATSLNGLAFLTSGAVTGIATSTLNLTTSSFASPNISQWTNDSGYLTTVDISANTNLTAGDALTLTNDDIDFDGGATPSGDLGGTWASPSVTDDSHAHTGTTLSGIDISSDTNLSGDTEVVLTGDALSLGAGVTRDTELVGLGSKWATSGTAILPNVTGTGIIVGASSTLQYLNSASSSITLLALPTVTSAITLTNGNGNVSAYAGTSCTNQFVRSLSALGVATCATVQTTDVASGIALDSELPTGSNPSATIGLTANNGVATTFMRSDASPALSQAIIPTWSQLHTFDAGFIATASSTAKFLTMDRATSTNATSTNLYVGGQLSFNGVNGSTWASFCTAITGGAGLCDGSDDGGAGGGYSLFSTSTVYTSSIFMNAGDSLGIGTTTNRSALSMLALATTTGNHLTMRNGNFTWFQKVNDTGSWFMGTTSGTYATATHSALVVPTTGGLIVQGSGSSTLRNGITIEAGCFSVNGTCIGSGGTLTGSNASAGRVPFWTSANNISGDDAFWWDNTNKRFGLGSTTPWARLSVEGTSTLGNMAFAGAFTATSSATSTFKGVRADCFSVDGTNCITGGASVVGGNPTATIGLSAVNGVATTYLRSDGAPALSQSITPTWTGLHTFNTGGILSTASSTIFAITSDTSTSTRATTTDMFSTRGLITTFISTLATIANGVFTTTLTIPNGTAPVADDVGEIAHDTTSNMLIMDDYVVGQGIQKLWSATFASTSEAFISSGLAPVPVLFQGYTITDIACKVDGGTSKIVAVEDASANTTEDITCGTTVTQDDGTITNATATALEEMYIDFGATSGTVDYVTISVYGTITRE